MFATKLNDIPSVCRVFESGTWRFNVKSLNIFYIIFPQSHVALLHWECQYCYVCGNRWHFWGKGPCFLLACGELASYFSSLVCMKDTSSLRHFSFLCSFSTVFGVTLFLKHYVINSSVLCFRVKYFKRWNTGNRKGIAVAEPGHLCCAIVAHISW